MSKDYQTHQSHTEEGNLSGLIHTSHNSHTHTGNTSQPEPQLKSSSCSSAIPSHNSKDIIPSHNSRNVTCLTLIPSHNSRDTLWATTQGIPASQPSRYYQSFVDHAHQQQSKHSFWLCNIAWRCSWAAKWNTLPDRLAGDTCLQAPSASVSFVYRYRLVGRSSPPSAKHHNNLLELQLSPSGPIPLPIATPVLA